MGQAKLRGSYEERKALAIQRQEAKRAERMAEEMRIRKIRPRGKSRTGNGVLAIAMSMAANAKGLT